MATVKHVAEAVQSSDDILTGNQKGLKLFDGAGKFMKLVAPAAFAPSLDYTLTLPVDDGGAGEALTTDGSGVLSWATPAGGGNVTAAGGATNYIPKFTGATAISNSVMYETGSKLGIGETSPDELLHITNGSGPIARLVLEGTGGNAAKYSVGTDSDKFAILEYGVSTPVTIEDGAGSNALYIKSGGNIGIGTTNPGSDKLYVSGGLFAGSATVGLNFKGQSGLDITVNTTSTPVRIGGRPEAGTHDCFKVRDFYGNTDLITVLGNGNTTLTGNIELTGDDTYFIPAKTTGLPGASASFRGFMIRTEGAGGVADVLYMCLKSSADTYSWVAVATG